MNESKPWIPSDQEMVVSTLPDSRTVIIGCPLCHVAIPYDCPYCNPDRLQAFVDNANHDYEEQTKENAALRARISLAEKAIRRARTYRGRDKDLDKYIRAYDAALKAMAPARPQQNMTPNKSTT